MHHGNQSVCAVTFTSAPASGPKPKCAHRTPGSLYFQHPKEYPHAISHTIPKRPTPSSRHWFALSAGFLVALAVLAYPPPRTPAPAPLPPSPPSVPRPIFSPKHIYSEAANPKADIVAGLAQARRSTSGSSLTLAATGAAIARSSTSTSTSPQTPNCWRRTSCSSMSGSVRWTPTSTSPPNTVYPSAKGFPRSLSLPRTAKSSTRNEPANLRTCATWTRTRSPSSWKSGRAERTLRCPAASAAASSARPRKVASSAGPRCSRGPSAGPYSASSTTTASMSHSRPPTRPSSLSFPALIVAAAVIGLLPDTAPVRFQLAEFFERVLPPGVSQLLDAAFEITPNHTHSVRALFSAGIVSFLGASNVIATLMEGFRRARELPTDPGPSGSAAGARSNWSPCAWLRWPCSASSSSSATPLPDGWYPSSARSRAPHIRHLGAHPLDRRRRCQRGTHRDDLSSGRAGQAAGAARPPRDAFHARSIASLPWTPPPHC